MKSPLISFIESAIQKTSRFLYRDFFEIELSQSSKQMMDSFVAKAYMRTHEALLYELKKHPHAGLVGDDGEPVKGKINFSISAIDGSKNLTRALPFFSISVCAYKLNESGEKIPLAAVIEFPALGDLYYAEHGKGVMFIKNIGASTSMKLKASVHSNPNMALVDEKFAEQFSCERRSFGSISYEIGLVISGKAEVMISEITDRHWSLIAKFLANETSCKAEEIGKYLVLSNGRFKIDL